MAIYYKSKAGETMTEGEWREWVQAFYDSLGYARDVPLPTDGFERAKRVLGLTIVDNDSSLLQYPEAHKNLEQER